MSFTLSGYSTALFSTWYFIEELGLLFDAGDGVISSLLQKSRKVNHVFISHADRDHLTGLFQFNQLNARKDLPEIYYPADCGSFPALENFTKQFDPHVSGTLWKAISAGTCIPLRKDLEIHAFANNHVPAKPGQTKSLSFKVVQVRTKLKTAFATLSGNEIKNLIAEKGKDFVSEEIRNTLISYSGDTPVDEYAKWDHSEILIHEATFLHKEEDISKEAHGNKHSTLQEVMQMVSAINIGKLVLGHFSSRYSAQQIREAIQHYYQLYQLQIPVYGVLPGQTVMNILQTDPVCG
jgi:ribonuclease Z